MKENLKINLAVDTAKGVAPYMELRNLKEEGLLFFFLKMGRKVEAHIGWAKDGVEVGKLLLLNIEADPRYKAWGGFKLCGGQMINLDLSKENKSGGYLAATNEEGKIHIEYAPQKELKGAYGVLLKYIHAQLRVKFGDEAILKIAKAPKNDKTSAMRNIMAEGLKALKEEINHE